jgi:hypothetical protein
MPVPSPEYGGIVEREITVACRDCDWTWYGQGRRGRAAGRSAALQHARKRGHRVDVRRELTTSYTPAREAM